VPVIARDIQRQNRAAPSSAPLSDAYIAGIPSKRRKLAQGNRPSSNPQLLLNGEFLLFRCGSCFV
jgi:hypothetical protein